MVIHEFFEIAIYRCSQKRFDERYKYDLVKHIQNIRKRGGTDSSQWSQTFEINVKQKFSDNYIAPWQYNQVVGFLRLHLLGSQIRGALWLSSAKRYTKRMKYKRFQLVGDGLQMQCWPEQTSTEIFKDLMNQLTTFESEFLRKGLKLDVECLQNLGPFIDWRDLVDRYP